MPTHGSYEERFPELFNQTSIDPRTRKRDRPMKVLVIGMMRTGTKSMKAALEELGYDGVYHMTSTIKNPEDCNMWVDALNAKFFNKGRKFTRADWDQLLGNVEACVDVPTAAFMPELIEAYPEAKVIVSMRDVDKWYSSFAGTVAKANAKWFLFLLALLDPFFLGKWGPMRGIMLKALFGGNGPNDEANVTKVYIDMHEEVRRMVPKDRLLEYKLGEGWEPICEFLDKDIPKTGFPFINESREFNERISLMERLAAARVAKSIAPLAGAMALASAWYFGMFNRFSM